MQAKRNKFIIKDVMPLSLVKKLFSRKKPRTIPQIEDLLGREPIKVDLENVMDMLQKMLMVKQLLSNFQKYIGHIIGKANSIKKNFGQKRVNIVWIQKVSFLLI